MYVVLVRMNDYDDSDDNQIPLALMCFSVYFFISAEYVYMQQYVRCPLSASQTMHWGNF